MKLLTTIVPENTANNVKIWILTPSPNVKRPGIATKADPPVKPLSGVMNIKNDLW